MSLIITIGRQFGSGGRDVGEKVAEQYQQRGVERG
mgnify:CR=1 FL=1